MQNQTQRAIELIRAGDRAAARPLLEQAVRANPDDALAWLWLSGAVQGEAERRECLRQVLRIDPQNANALRGLQRLEQNSHPPQQEQRSLEHQQPAPAEPEQPAAPAAGVSAPARPAPPAPAPRKTPPQTALQKPVKARPSQVPVLLSFWVFLGGTALVGWLLRGLPALALPVAAALGALLLLVVLYCGIRNSFTRYQFDGMLLNLPFRGRRTSLPIWQIQAVECQQSFFQRMIQTGNVRIYAVLRGELVRLTLRNIAGCKRFTQHLQNALGAE